MENTTPTVKNGGGSIMLLLPIVVDGIVNWNLFRISTQQTEWTAKVLSLKVDTTGCFNRTVIPKAFQN